MCVCVFIYLLSAVKLEGKVCDIRQVRSGINIHMFISPHAHAHTKKTVCNLSRLLVEKKGGGKKGQS